MYGINSVFEFKEHGKTLCGSILNGLCCHEVRYSHFFVQREIIEKSKRKKITQNMESNNVISYRQIFEIQFWSKL